MASHVVPPLGGLRVQVEIEQEKVRATEERLVAEERRRQAEVLKAQVEQMMTQRPHAASDDDDSAAVSVADAVVGEDEDDGRLWPDDHMDVEGGSSPLADGATGVESTRPGAHGQAEASSGAGPAEKGPMPADQRADAVAAGTLWTPGDEMPVGNRSERPGDPVSPATGGVESGRDGDVGGGDDGTDDDEDGEGDVDTDIPLTQMGE